MTQKTFILIVMIVAAFFFFAPGAAQQLDHRDDYRMNSVSGGSFRDYVTNNIEEDDQWARSMRKLGTFHNLMHEMMSDLARYGELKGEEDLVPDFGVRISGGTWEQYRKTKEEAEVESDWHDFVRITEIMHDRVHHVMYNTLVYDNESRDRGLDMDDYTGDRPVYSSEQVLPDPWDVSVTTISQDDFRELVWHNNFEEVHLHSALQKMQVFSEMMNDLMDIWARYASRLEDEACWPPDHEGQMTGPEWERYSKRVMMCRNDHWRDMVRSVNLMHNRISHMNYMIVRYLNENDMIPADFIN